MSDTDMRLDTPHNYPLILNSSFPYTVQYWTSHLFLHVGQSGQPVDVTSRLAFILRQER
jgi:hypothetical protein